MTIKKSILLITIISLVLTLPFLNKAFYIDGYPYIRTGEWAKKYHFRADKIMKKKWNWEGKKIPCYSATHPPLFYAIVGSALYLMKKPNEVKLHIISVLFVILAAISMFFVAKRFTRYPLLASLLLVGSPGFLTISHSLTADIPMVALFLASIWAYLSATEKRSKMIFAVSGILATFATLVSFQGLFLILLLIIYPFINGKRVRGASFSWVIPIIVFAIWCIFIFWAVRAFILFTAPTISVQNTFFNLPLFVKKFIGNISMIGGTTIFPLILLFVFAKKRKVAFFLIFVIITILTFVLARDYTATEKWLLIFFLSTGFMVIWEFLVIFFEENTPEKIKFIFLSIWYIGFLVAATFLLPYASTRYLIPIFPPLIILFVKQLENYRGFIRTTSLILTVISGLSVAVSDYQRADIYRIFAKSLKQEIKNKNVWFVGEWGIRYYLEQEGFKYLLFDNDTIPEGSIIIKAGMPAYYFNKMPLKMKSRLYFIKRISYRGRSPIRLMDVKCHAGFYSNWKGRAPLPYSFSTSVLDYFDIYKFGNPNYFINTLKKAKIETDVRGFKPVSVASWTINDISKNVIFEHPTTSISYKLRIPKNARLSFSIALKPDVWSPKKGDGVEFKIIAKCKMQNAKCIFSRYIDPKNNLADRKWHNEEVDLSEYAGKEVILTFITLPGPKKDGRWDWAGWAEPVVKQ